MTHISPREDRVPRMEPELTEKLRRVLEQAPPGTERVFPRNDAIGNHARSIVASCTSIVMDQIECLRVELDKLEGALKASDDDLAGRIRHHVTLASVAQKSVDALREAVQTWKPQP